MSAYILHLPGASSHFTEQHFAKCGLTLLEWSSRAGASLTHLGALTAFAVRRRKQASRLIAHVATFVDATPDLDAFRGVALGVLLSVAAWCAILTVIIWVM